LEVLKLAFVPATLWALLLAFASLMQRNLEGWHTTTPLQYVTQDVVAFLLFLVPPSIFLGFVFPRLSWWWGVVLTWPLALWGAYATAQGCPIAPPCGRFDLGSAIAGVVNPAILVLTSCATALLAARTRQRLGLTARQNP